MVEHRVPMLSPSLHRPPDPERSRDPRVRAVVGRLRALNDELPAPEADFRAELRAQLVAITPRIVVEGDHAVVRRPLPVRGASARVAAPAPAPVVEKRRRIRLGRPLAIVGSLVVVFAMLLGGAVWISQRALPGDTLYGLKRTSEDVRLSLAGSDADRAKLSLEFAANRYDEVRALLPSKPTTTQPSAHTASLVSSTLSAADSDLRDATQAYARVAQKDKSGQQLSAVTSWAKAPIAQLKAKADNLPAGPVLDRMVASWKLLVRADEQADAVSKLGSTVTKLPSNSVGLYVPASLKSAQTPTHPTKRSHTPTTAPAPATSGGSAPAQTGGGSAPASNAPAAPAPSAPASGGSSSSSGGGGINIPLGPTSSNGSCPGIDLGVVSVGACGVNVGG